MLSEASMEWPLLLDGINVGYCNTVSVGSLTLQISLSLSLFLSHLSENQIPFSEAANGGVLQEKVFLENSQNSQETICKPHETRPRSQTLLKQRLPHRCFTVNFAKFLRKYFYRAPPRDCFSPLIKERLEWYDCDCNIYSCVVLTV